MVDYEAVQNKWRETGIEDRGHDHYTLHLPDISKTEWMTIDEALSMARKVQSEIPATPLPEGMTRDLFADIKRIIADNERLKWRIAKYELPAAQTGGNRMTLPDEIYLDGSLAYLPDENYSIGADRILTAKECNLPKYTRADAAPKVEELVFALKLAHATIIADKGYGYRPDTYKIITGAIKKYDTLTPKHAEEENKG
jgi:hypothetical protein